MVKYYCVEVILLQRLFSTFLVMNSYTDFTSLRGYSYIDVTYWENKFQELLRDVINKQHKILEKLNDKY